MVAAAAEMAQSSPRLPAPSTSSATSAASPWLIRASTTEPSLASSASMSTASASASVTQVLMRESAPRSEGSGSSESGSHSTKDDGSAVGESSRRRAIQIALGATHAYQPTASTPGNAAPAPSPATPSAAPLSYRITVKPRSVKPAEAVAEDGAGSAGLSPVSATAIPSPPLSTAFRRSSVTDAHHPRRSSISPSIVSRLASCWFPHGGILAYLVEAFVAPLIFLCILVSMPITQVETVVTMTTNAAGVSVASSVEEVLISLPRYIWTFALVYILGAGAMGLSFVKVAMSQLPRRVLIEFFLALSTFILLWYVPTSQRIASDGFYQIVAIVHMCITGPTIGCVLAVWYIRQLWKRREEARAHHALVLLHQQQRQAAEAAAHAATAPAVHATSHSTAPSTSAQPQGVKSAVLGGSQAATLPSADAPSSDEDSAWEEDTSVPVLTCMECIDGRLVVVPLYGKLVCCMLIISLILVMMCWCQAFTYVFINFIAGSGSSSSSSDEEEEGSTFRAALEVVASTGFSASFGLFRWCAELLMDELYSLPAPEEFWPLQRTPAAKELIERMDGVQFQASSVEVMQERRRSHVMMVHGRPSVLSLTPLEISSAIAQVDATTRMPVLRSVVAPVVFYCCDLFQASFHRNLFIHIRSVQTAVAIEVVKLASDNALSLYVPLTRSYARALSFLSERVSPRIDAAIEWCTRGCWKSDTNKIKPEHREEEEEEGMDAEAAERGALAAAVETEAKAERVDSSLHRGEWSVTGSPPPSSCATFLVHWWLKQSSYIFASISFVVVGSLLRYNSNAPLYPFDPSRLPEAHFTYLVVFTPIVFAIQVLNLAACEFWLRRRFDGWSMTRDALRRVQIRPLVRLLMASATWHIVSDVYNSLLRFKLA